MIRQQFMLLPNQTLSGLFAGPSRQFLPLSFKTQPIESSPNAKLLFLTNITPVKDLCFTQQKMLAGTSETQGKYLVRHIPFFLLFVLCVEILMSPTPVS
jgi:hypothetical protein